MNHICSSEVTVNHVSIESLTPQSRNARTHSKQQIRQIAASIKEFGFTNPFLIDRTNKIIAGRGRVAAAKLLGMKLVPTIRLENLTEDQIRAYVIADNRLAENAGWDSSMLAIELQHLLTIDGALDATITGFEVPEIDLILREASGKQDEDDVFDVEETNLTVTQSGEPRRPITISCPILPRRPSSLYCLFYRSWRWIPFLIPILEMIPLRVLTEE